MPPVQAPAWQVSPVVQALASLQVVPFVLATGAGQPVAGTQAPTVWHWSAVQTTGVPALQVPAPSQVSAPLQALPSLHDVPAAADAWVQVPLVPQVSIVQGLPSLQDCAVQVPFEKPSWYVMVAPEPPNRRRAP